MAVVNLPDSPANGTTQTVGGITYTYNSSKGYWTAASSGGGGGGGASVTTSDSAPSSPSDGDLWYDTDDGGMFVYYGDGSSSQWVEVIGTQGAQGTLSTSDSAPSSPSDGDLWYDTDDGGLFIYYADGSSSQWVEVVGQAGVQGPAGPSGATTIVANTTALLAISSPSTGEMAYVTGNSTLYFWNGSGWYKIALINTTPSISGANASYALATDGTATTVTLVASDPEGLPITYSIASDTSGNIATVSQGTGASTNVWTITPSTNTAHAGTFSLTFRASDGVNFGTAASSFTLQFSIQNSKYTQALVTSTGANGAQNANTFDDASTSNHTLTRSLATQTSFSPYRPGGYSQYFDGNGDYIQTDTNYTCSGEFTIEFWMHSSAYVTSGANSRIFASVGGSNAANNFQLIIGKSSDSGSTGGSIDIWTNAYTAQGTTNVSDGAWHHIAVTRNSSNLITLYIDGTSNVTGTNTTAFSFSNSRIGTRDATNDATSKFNGYIRDLRVVEGTAVYTSNFTPPTETLTAITNTSLLVCNQPYQRDMSSNNHSLLCYGHLKAIGFGPYDSGLEYDTAVHGGSIDCRSDGAAVHVADSDDFTFGSGDWTIEFWTYRTGGTGSDYQAVIVGVGSWAIEFMSNNRLSAWFSSGSSGSWDLLNQGTLGHADGSSGNNWHHYAVQRSGNYLVTYQNGVQTDNRSFTGTIGNPTAINIGYYNGSGNDMTGFISDLHVIKGTAKYSANFIPPTQRLSLHSNTKLSVPATEAGIIDKSQALQYIDCYNGVASSTTQTKYYNSSIYFDGTNDYLALGGGIGQFGTQDFTIELWAYASATGSYAYLIEARNSSSSNNTWTLSFNYMGNVNNDILQFATFNGSSATAFLTSNTAFPTGTWKHIAVARSGTTMKMFFDGTEVASNSSAGFDFALNQDPIYIGTRYSNQNYFNGYMSDIRITKGFARYTSNFTAPTAALQG